MGVPINNTGILGDGGYLIRCLTWESPGGQTID